MRDGKRKASYSVQRKPSTGTDLLTSIQPNFHHHGLLHYYIILKASKLCRSGGTWYLPLSFWAVIPLQLWRDEMNLRNVLLLLVCCPCRHFCSLLNEYIQFLCFLRFYALVFLCLVRRSFFLQIWWWFHYLDLCFSPSVSLS